MFKENISRTSYFDPISIPVISQQHSLWVHSLGSNRVEITLYEKGNKVPIEFCRGIPSLVSKNFFSKSYAVVTKLSSEGYVLELFGRVCGGGNVNSADSNRTGSALTRSIDEMARPLKFGSLKTQQDLEDKIKEVMTSINLECAEAITTMHKMTPTNLDISMNSLVELDHSLEKKSDECDLNYVLENIDKRISFLRARTSTLDENNYKLLEVIDTLTLTITNTSKNMSQINAFQGEIIELKEDRNSLESAVSYAGSKAVVLSITLDGLVLDPVLGAKPGTDIISFLDGYDCMGRPPTRIEDIDKWLNDSQLLKNDLGLKKKEIGQKMVENDRMISRLEELRAHFVKKKIDVIADYTIATLVLECQEITASLIN